MGAIKRFYPREREKEREREREREDRTQHMLRIGKKRKNVSMKNA